MLSGYLYFYNPLWLAVALLRRKTKVGIKPAGMQLVGMFGLIQTIRSTSGWALRLMFGKIERLTEPPASAIPLHGVAGATATHETFKPTVTIHTRRSVPLPVAG